jgi:demethoxyubiquinone hydroxylase (CLK1/Coq7/Cat5 family)
MNSNFGKSTRIPLSAVPTPTSTTVDPDASGLTVGQRAVADTDPAVIPPRFEDDEPSGVTTSWEDTKLEVSNTVRDIKETITEKVTSNQSFTGGDLRSASIDKLNECLRGEISAVETYNLALKSLDRSQVAAGLRQLRDSHDQRVMMIRDRIRSLGDVPSESAGAWGAFATIVQRGADLLGDQTALAALEQGEDHGLNMYTAELDDVDLMTRDFIHNDLLPMQRQTHDLCRSLFRFVKAA